MASNFIWIPPEMRLVFDNRLWGNGTFPHRVSSQRCFEPALLLLLGVLLAYCSLQLPTGTHLRLSDTFNINQKMP